MDKKTQSVYSPSPTQTIHVAIFGSGASASDAGGVNLSGGTGAAAAAAAAAPKLNTGSTGSETWRCNRGQTLGPSSTIDKGNIEK